MITELDTAYVHFFLKDNMLIAYYKEGLQVDIIKAKQIVRDRLHFTNHQSFPVLIYNLGVISIDKEARDYFSSQEGIQAIKASAIINPSVYSYVLINFFLSVTKPPIRVRMFRNDKRAIRWLQQFID